MTWFYVDDGQQSGPVTDEQLEELLRSGKITPDTLIWREGMHDWQPYRQVKPVGGPAPSTQPTWPAVQNAPGAVCAECGKMFNLDEMTRHGDVYICPNCKPIFARKMGAGTRIGTDPLAFNFAGFWIRFAAKFVDGIITNIITFPIVFGMGLAGGLSGSAEANIAAQVVVMGISLIIGVAYYVFFVGKYGATPGKMVCQLKIVQEDGGKVGYGRAAGRFFAEILSGCPTLLIGYIMAGMDEEKRALHDRICGTRVIYK